MTSADKVLANTNRVSDILKQTFSNLTFAKVMKQYGESVVGQFCRQFNMLTVPSCSGMRLFTYLTIHIFRTL